MFVHLLRNPDARYAIGAVVNWPRRLVYIHARYFSETPAARVSWILSYSVVYAVQKYGTFGAMGREAMLREVA